MREDTDKCVDPKTLTYDEFGRILTIPESAQDSTVPLTELDGENIGCGGGC